MVRRLAQEECNTKSNTVALYDPRALGSALLFSPDRCRVRE